MNVRISRIDRKMSLCYDLHKWTRILITNVAISLIVGLFLLQDTHGITEEQRQANREKYAGLIEEDIKKQDNQTSGCVDQNLCSVPSAWFADKQKVLPLTPELSTQEPDPFDGPNRIMCELVQGGFYYEDNGEAHCITH